MASQTKKCGHPACNCMVAEEDRYCSPYCHDAAGTTEISCNCGHDACLITEDEPQSTTNTLR